MKDFFFFLMKNNSSLDFLTAGFVLCEAFFLSLIVFLLEKKQKPDSQLGILTI